MVIYMVNVYKIKHTFSHVLPNNHEVVEFWPRPSCSNEFDTLVGDSLLPRERIKILSCDDYSCIIEGNVYEVFDLNNNALGWWPYNPYTQPTKVEYTVLTRDITASMNNLKSNKNLSLFPNPTKEENSILIKGKKGKKLHINLFDIQGRFIKTIYDGVINSDSFSTTTNLQNLESSMYFYSIIIDNNKEVLRFIKQ